MRRIYLDSCILIYLIEKHPVFGATILRRLVMNPEARLAVSPLVRLEVLTRPLREKDIPLINAYERFIATQQVLPVSAASFDLALHLRVRYRLKTPDALHLAIAQSHGCAEVWTHDSRLHEAASDQAVNVLATIR
ncbi:Ribonuclease VapC [Gammaproteobacteria bacterium]